MEHYLLAKTIEGHDLIEPVPEFRRKCLLDGVFYRALAHLSVSKTDKRLPKIPGAGVRCHNDDDISKICFPPGVVCKGCVIHYLEQDVKDILMGLFYFVEQQHRVGCFPDSIRKKSALFIPHIARGRTDKPCHRMLFLVLAHIKTVNGNPKDICKLPCQFCLTYTGWTDEEKVSHGLVRLAESCTGTLYRLYDCFNRMILPVDPLF